MKWIRTAPVTVFLLLANVLVFGYVYFQAGSFEEPGWTLLLLQMGAEYNPLTLDREWYRLFTHQFLHGHIPHLLFNMYALVSVGMALEGEIGSNKFAWLYFLSGLAAAVSSLYFTLFTIGVGASGAIFGLFGFSLVLNLFHSKKQGLPIAPILINFGIFMAINLLFASALRADNSAHMGGLAMGVLLAAGSILQPRSESIRMEWMAVMIIAAIYVMLPRYQVDYFKFFQRVLDVQDSARLTFRQGLTDDQFLLAFRKDKHNWMGVRQQLDSLKEVPPALESDTFKLRRYLRWKWQQASYRVTMVEKESYIYMDSIEIADQKMTPFLSLDYVLNLTRTLPEEEPQPLPREGPSPIKQWYDANWQEIPYPPGSFYRIGVRDSIGRWQGPVRDHYANGDVQMKGAYQDSKQEGIFIYYSDHGTYESAGRYEMGNRVGKWESFFPNGRLESEVYYRDRYFLKSLWDSLGNQLVREGEGHVVKRYSNGVVAEEGSYRDGYQEGVWQGRHADGQPFYEEYYSQGRLVRGRSRDPQGRSYVYDFSSFFPVPEGGFANYRGYLERETARIMPDVDGTVVLSFRINPGGAMLDLEVEKSVSLATDTKAKEIVSNGPRWLPAHEHGYVPVDGFQRVEVTFVKSF